MITAVSVEASTPRVPSRPCQGEAQYSAARMRAPLSGLLARITLVTPLRPHTASCSTNHLSEVHRKITCSQQTTFSLCGVIPSKPFGIISISCLFFLQMLQDTAHYLFFSWISLCQFRVLKKELKKGV